MLIVGPYRITATGWVPDLEGIDRDGVGQGLGGHCTGQEFRDFDSDKNGVNRDTQVRQ